MYINLDFFIFSVMKSHSHDPLKLKAIQFLSLNEVAFIELQNHRHHVGHSRSELVSKVSQMIELKHFFFFFFF